MTPKEKAIELFNKFCYAIRTEETDSGYYTNVIYAKNCALIAVEEILNENSKRGGENDEIIQYEPYWLQVKHEINNI